MYLHTPARSSTCVVPAPLKSSWFGAPTSPTSPPRPPEATPKSPPPRQCSRKSVRHSVSPHCLESCELRPSTPSLAATTTFRLITTPLILSSYAYRRFLFDCASTRPRQTSSCSPSTRILRRLARSRPPTAARTTSIHPSNQPATAAYAPFASSILPPPIARSLSSAGSVCAAALYYDFVPNLLS